MCTLIFLRRGSCGAVTIVLTVAALLPLNAQASCGSAFCTLMTDRYVQGTGEPHAGWSLDLRLESVTQDHLRSGTSNVDPAAVTNEGAIERHTRNLNFVNTIGYGVDEHWSLSLRVPVVHRDHLHNLLDAQTGLPGAAESWRFTGLGDVQGTLRWQTLSQDGKTSYAFTGGMQLPTGSIAERNADGSRAERAMQPGSGTHDILYGAAVRRAVGLHDALIAQAGMTQAIDTREQFRPGRRFDTSVGWSHAYSHQIGSVVQLNFRNRSRDSGLQAEPDNSGSTTLNLSPGVTVGLGHSSTLYAYVQLPLYQRVNGIQLVPQHALAFGWTGEF
jgi:hypothetical protein